MAPTGLLDSFVASIQASLSVLLVIFYGGLAGWLNLLTPANTKAISKICVRMFLPALFITQIGSDLCVGSANRYLIVFVWSILCHLISFLIGVVAHAWLGMPDWITVALMFNTTSYPLLLIAALDQTGILTSLLVTDETSKAAAERAKSYFLIFATVSSCLIFAVGPRLIGTEDPSEASKESEHGIDNAVDSDDEVNENTKLLRSSLRLGDPSMQNSFLPSYRKIELATSAPQPVDRKASVISRSRWVRLSPRTKWWLLFMFDFFNAPSLGAITGVIIGLVPFLHRIFFNEIADGGIFTAWLTTSLRDIGRLFIPLPVLVAGVSLYTSMQQPKRATQDQVRLPLGTVMFVLFLRFVAWPAVSITIIYTLASKTDILGPDPMLWFAMMLMPTGPPAMKLITLVQVSDAGEKEEAIIAKLLTISYIASPVLSLTVVGALRATQTAIS